MTTSPDSVTYTQSIGEVGGPVDAVSWQSTARPPFPMSGMYGYAADLDNWEFRIGSAWRHPAWLEGATFTGAVSLTQGITVGSNTFTGVPIQINGTTAATRQIRWLSAGGLRWAVGVSPDTSSNFSINRYDDSGVLQGTSLLVNRSSGLATFGNNVAADASYSVTGDITLAPRININGGITTGTNTAIGNTGPALVKIGGTFSGAMTSGTFNYLGLYINASGFDTAVCGMVYQLATTGAATVSSPSFGLIGGGGVAIGNHNLGGSATGFGASQFGSGVLFGWNPRANLRTGGTFYAGVVGEEVGGSMMNGTSAGYFAIQQIVLEDGHDASGLLRDCMVVFGAQGGISRGVREGLEIGGAAVHWPIKPTGYIIAAHIAATQLTRPAQAAGFLDCVDLDLTTGGTGTWGGGFILRGEGASVIPSSGNGGAVRTGHASLSSSATGATLAVDQDKMTGTPAINAAGTNWENNMCAGDVHGNVVQVTASGGAVTGITVIRRAWVPRGTGATTGVAFTCKNVVNGGFGQGLTLNLTWTSQNALTIQPTTGQTIYMPALQASTSYANDAAAAAGGVAVGQLYRNGSVIQCRIV